MVGKQVSLADFTNALSESPGDRHGNSVSAVRDFVRDAVATSHNGVTVRALGEGEPRMTLKHKRLRGCRQGMRHGARFLRHPNICMTLRAGSSTHILGPLPCPGGLPVESIELALDAVLSAPERPRKAERQPKHNDRRNYAVRLRCSLNVPVSFGAVGFSVPRQSAWILDSRLIHGARRQRDRITEIVLGGRCGLE